MRDRIVFPAAVAPLLRAHFSSSGWLETSLGLSIKIRFMASTPPQSRSESFAVRVGGSRRWLFRLAAVLVGLARWWRSRASARFAIGDGPACTTIRSWVFARCCRCSCRARTARATKFPRLGKITFAPSRSPPSSRAESFACSAWAGRPCRANPWASKPRSQPGSKSHWARPTIRPWQVVNCGGVSYASYRLTPILEEVLTYQPDLMIVCTGHNEFLEARSSRIAAVL